MAQISWSDEARAHFDEALTYLSRQSRRNARLFVRNTERVVTAIGDQPLIGALVEEYGRPDVRERQQGPYRIIYQVAEDTVRIMAIWRASRPLPAQPPGLSIS